MSHRPVKVCECGARHRSKGPWCGSCQANEHALPPGEWVARRGVRVFVPSADGVVAPVPRPERTRAATCDRCGVVLRDDGTCHSCERRIPALIFPGRPICACGCLLARAGEECPACLANEWFEWAVEVEREHNRRTYRRAA